MPHHRFHLLSITLSATVLGCGLPAQDAPGFAAHLDQALHALTEADPRYGYAVAIAGLDGPIDVHVAGRIDDQTDFERWHLVPLGSHTVLLLEAVMRDSIGKKKLRWEQTVLGAGTPDPIDLDSAWFDHQLPLPGYLRYVSTAKESRPLADIVRIHAFRLPPHVFPLCDQGMLRCAIAQSALESALGHSWPELLREAKNPLSMTSLIDLSQAWPARSVALGHRGDGGPWPMRLAEVASAANAACSIDDVAQLARACLRDELTGHPPADAHELRPSRRFFDSEDPGFNVATRRTRSDILGCTLELQLLPEARKVIVLFGTRLPDRWEDKLRTPAMELALGVDASTLQIDEMFATQEMEVEDEASTVEGVYRGRIELGAKTVEIEIRSKDRKGIARIIGGSETSKPAPEGPLSIGPDYAFSEIGIDTPTEDVAGVIYRLVVAVDPRDTTRLSGVVYVIRTTPEHVEFECLPYPARFTRLP